MKTRWQAFGSGVFLGGTVCWIVATPLNVVYCEEPIVAVWMVTSILLAIVGGLIAIAAEPVDNSSYF